MDAAQLSKFEHDNTIIKKYVKSSAFGKSKVVYLPLVIGIGMLCFLALVIFGGLIETIGIGVITVLSAIAVICFVMVAVINRSAHKKLSQETKMAPVCIAKKVYGNDKQHVYYCIYSPGEKRHDNVFILIQLPKKFSLSPLILMTKQKEPS